MEETQKLTITVPRSVARFLELLDDEGKPEVGMAKLVAAAEQGLKRPRSWYRPWVVDAFLGVSERLKSAYDRGELRATQEGVLEWTR